MLDTQTSPAVSTMTAWGCSIGQHRRTLMAVLALLAGLAIGQTARADDRETARKVCMADYKKHCSGIFPGGGRVRKCLTDNLSKLEPACREIVARNAGGEKASQSR